MRSTWALLLAGSLLVPLAAAEGVEPALGMPALPDASALRDRTAASLAVTGDALADAAGIAAAAFARALDAAASALAAVGAALASAAIAIASAFASVLGAAAGYARTHPRETAIVAGTTAGATGLAWLLKRFGALALLPLYTRLAPSEMLDNEARSRVYEHVRANPGAHVSAIAQALGLGWGTTVYHLQRLESSRLVVSRSAHHRKCFFAVGTSLDAAARGAVAAMAHDKAKLIVQTVHAAPGISQKEVATRVGMSQALASWHVKRLVESGVLRTQRAGRANALTVADHVPVAVA